MTNSDDVPTARHALPGWLNRYATIGPYALVAGTALCLFTLFTNPVPDPSFPWFTLPSSLHLPVRQPRIEHWPVTYTLGVWLWVFCFPALFLAGYRRYRDTLDATWWLVGFPTAAMVGWTTYCRFFWPKPQPPTWNAPAYTFVCWVYCSTYEPFWSNAAYVVAGIGVVATVIAARRLRADTLALAGFGVLSLPLGLPVLFAASRRQKTR